MMYDEDDLERAIKDQLRLNGNDFFAVRRRVETILEDWLIETRPDSPNVHWRNQCGAYTEGSYYVRPRQCGRSSTTGHLCWQHARLYGVDKSIEEDIGWLVNRWSYEALLAGGWLPPPNPKDQAKRYEGSVYYYRGDDGCGEFEGLVKIGKSVNVESRVRSLPSPGTLLATEPGGREVERYRHFQFRRTRVRGEWFEVNRSLRRHIHKLMRGRRVLNGSRPLPPELPVGKLRDLWEEKWEEEWSAIVRH